MAQVSSANQTDESDCKKIHLYHIIHPRVGTWCLGHPNFFLSYTFVLLTFTGTLFISKGQQIGVHKAMASWALGPQPVM